MKEFFKKIHTENFRWYDEILLVSFFSFLLVLLGQILGTVILGICRSALGLTDGFWETFLMYFQTFGVWIVMLAFFAIFKHRRPIFKAIGTKPKGNNLKYLGLGLLIGFGLNFGCAVVAMLHKDIHIHFSRFEILPFIALLFAVFVQSSSEELVDRAYVFQVARKGYRSKWVAIIGNALIFSLMHGANPGVTALALANIFFSGLLFSLFVYYFDSLWCAYGIHTGWNFTQSILLGLPNSGLVVPYSNFELDTAAATNSFAYNVAFGIEGTILSTVVLAVACLIVYLLGEKRNQQPIDIWNQ